MPNVFITGGTGFIGCNLLEYAVEHLPDYHFTVLTRDPYAFNGKAPHLASHPNIKVYPGDIKTFRYPLANYDYIIHGALDTANLAPSGLQGTAHLSEFANQQDCKVLYLSSGAVYHDPLSAYGWVKRQGEKILDNAVKARLFTFTGNYLPQDDRFAIGRFIKQAKGGDPISLYGGKQVYRSYMHTSDMAHWCWKILLHGQPGQAYNVGSEEPISIYDLAYHIAQLFHVKVIESNGPDTGNSYLPNTEATRKELGLSIQVGLDDAILKTIEWQKVGIL